MKYKIILFFVITAIILSGCTTEPEDQEDIQATFESLPVLAGIPKKTEDGALTVSFQESGYQGTIAPVDPADTDWLGHVQTTLSYEGQSILDSEFYWATFQYGPDIVRLVENYPGTPQINTVYYRGEKITGNLYSKNKRLAAINAIRLHGQYMYLQYYSRVNTWYDPDVPASYGRYNLKTGQLKIVGPGLPE